MAISHWPKYVCVVTLIVLGMVVLAACGASETSTSATRGMTQSLSGVIEIDGSSTVAPISQAVAEEFEKINGDTAAHRRYFRHRWRLQALHRRRNRYLRRLSYLSKKPKLTTAADNGIEYLELKVGTDGLSVMVSPRNDFVDCLTRDQLHEIWKPGSSVQKWSDINLEWPDRDIRLYGADTDSGTFDYFTEAVNGEAKVSRDDYTASADDNVLIRGIAGDRNSLGYFGYAYYIENADQLKLLGVDNGEGCVKPSPETIASGTYNPLSRPLLIYVNVESLQKPQVLEFVKFYMEMGAELTAEVGYVPEDDSVFQSNLQAVLDAAS